MIDYVMASRDKLLEAFIEHLKLSLITFGIAILLAVCLSLLVLYHPKGNKVLIYSLSLLYAVPSFAFFTILIPLTGLGQLTAIIVLVSYAQYILVRSFLISLYEVPNMFVEVAEGLGMTRWQILWKVQLPLGQKGIFAGLRLTSSAIIAMSTIASIIHAGGLGDILFEGLRTTNRYELLWGILLTVILSVIFNFFIYLIELLCRIE